MWILILTNRRKLHVLLRTLLTTCPQRASEERRRRQVTNDYRDKWETTNVWNHYQPFYLREECHV